MLPRSDAPRSAAFYEVAAGASMSWSGSPAAAAILAAGWVPRGAGPGLHFSATVESKRALDLTPGLASGQATWRRWTGSVELDWRLPGGAWALDLHGGLGLGWLDASGVGFSHNHSGYSFSPGGTAGVRQAASVENAARSWRSDGRIPMATAPQGQPSRLSARSPTAPCAYGPIIVMEARWTAVPASKGPPGSMPQTNSTGPGGIEVGTA